MDYAPSDLTALLINLFLIHVEDASYIYTSLDYISKHVLKAMRAAFI